MNAHLSTAKRLLELASEMDALTDKCMAPWLGLPLDPAGGVFGFLNRSFSPVVDEEGAPGGPSGEHRGDKSLIQQSRHLYSYSLLYQRRAYDERVVERAHACFDFLFACFVKDGAGCLRHQVNRLGEPREEREQCYAQSFATYGLATYALAFADEEPTRAARAAELARQVFLAWNVSRWDGRFGGYDQGDDGGWLAYVLAPEGARKCTNTHIHILEALTPLTELFPEDLRISSRLKEMVSIICQRLLQPSDYVHKHFALDWSPVGEPEVSYGHDLETSWLVREAATLFGHREVELAENAAKRMAEHALRTGWDEAGGVFDFGVPELHFAENQPRVIGTEKVWWAQAEALPGIYRLYQQTGDGSLLDKLVSSFRFLQEKSFDRESGEFFWGVDSEGRVGPRGDHKGEIWKTPYHALRALVLTADWIRADHSV